ncbi:helix-turn-helix domain-containing protein [Bosea thiooxidans]|nr:helix-turn-helix domain-containing protein [Bosea sp. (in: a-proteobacteria)]
MLSSTAKVANSISRSVSLQTLDTTGLTTARQIPEWEAHTSRHLMEVRCSSANCSPLLAVQRNGVSGPVAVAEMKVSAHVVERSSVEVMRDPRDVALVIMLLEGEGMFGQGGRWVAAQPGDIVALTSDLPFILTYPRLMRQLVLCLPQAEFALLCGRRLAGPEYLSGSELGEGAFHWLARRGLESLSEEGGPGGDDVRELGLGMVAEIFTQVPAKRTERLTASFLGAQAWIADHLSDPALSPPRVARALGISVRHLNRIFAQQATTVRRTVAERRLQLARHMLQDPARACLSIGEIAFLVGFSDQSLFSRQFHRKFGVPPSTVRHGRYGADHSACARR